MPAMDRRGEAPGPQPSRPSYNRPSRRSTARTTPSHPISSLLSPLHPPRGPSSDLPPWSAAGRRLLVRPLVDSVSPLPRHLNNAVSLPRRRPPGAGHHLPRRPRRPSRADQRGAGGMELQGRCEVVRHHHALRRAQGAGDRGAQGQPAPAPDARPPLVRPPPDARRGDPDAAARRLDRESRRGVVGGSGDPRRHKPG